MASPKPTNSPGFGEITVKLKNYPEPKWDFKEWRAWVNTEGPDGCYTRARKYGYEPYDITKLDYFVKQTATEMAIVERDYYEASISFCYGSYLWWSAFTMAWACIFQAILIGKEESYDSQGKNQAVEGPA